MRRLAWSPLAHPLVALSCILVLGACESASQATPTPLVAASATGESNESPSEGPTQVLHGQLDLSLRDAEGIETTVALRQGDVFVVPQGLMHKPSSPGCSVLMFEPSGTSGTGDQHEGEIPAHVDVTTGHDLT